MSDHLRYTLTFDQWVALRAAAAHLKGLGGCLVDAMPVASAAAVKMASEAISATDDVKPEVIYDTLPAFVTQSDLDRSFEWGASA